MHDFQVILIQKEGLKEGITFDYSIAIRSVAPEKFEFEFVLIKYNPFVGGVGKDEFLLLRGGGQVMFGGKEKEGGCREGKKSVFRAEFIPGCAFDVVDYS